MINNKIQEHHREKTAFVYLRQSTMGQVRYNQESTERQYALKEKALDLGWPLSRIRVLDRDLGISGTQMSNREDFKSLVAAVSMNQVGAVFALEASRLAQVAGNLRPDRHSHHRRRRMLQPRRFQRSAPFGTQRHHVTGRASFYSRPPPRWQAQ